MPALATATISSLLSPYFPAPDTELLDQLSIYLDLLLKWNARTNLSAIRTPEEIVQRHFGESLFAARYIRPDALTLLDLGSGAGFPGVPIALAHPTLRVTLAESQNKKASFLREVIRSLEIPTEVWGDRVENLPANRLFDVVALRAVDNPQQALELARTRVHNGGLILHITSNPADKLKTHQIPLSHSSFVEVLG